jgi:hypothetical protein
VKSSLHSNFQIRIPQNDEHWTYDFVTSSRRYVASVFADRQPQAKVEFETPTPKKEVTKVPSFNCQLLDKIHSSLLETAALSLKSLLLKHLNTCSISENVVGQTDMVVHSVYTGNAKPNRQRLRCFPPAHVLVSLNRRRPRAPNVVLVVKRTVYTAAVSTTVCLIRSLTRTHILCQG